VAVVAGLVDGRRGGVRPDRPDPDNAKGTRGPSMRGGSARGPSAGASGLVVLICTGVGVFRACRYSSPPGANDSVSLVTFRLSRADRRPPRAAPSSERDRQVHRLAWRPYRRTSPAIRQRAPGAAILMRQPRANPALFASPYMGWLSPGASSPGVCSGSWPSGLLKLTEFPVWAALGPVCTGPGLEQDALFMKLLRWPDEGAKGAQGPPGVGARGRFLDRP